MTKMSKLNQLSTFCVAITVILTANCQDFGYDGAFGPKHWGEQYNSCDGKKQSPINIDLSHVTKWSFPPLIFDRFDMFPESTEIKNNGHTVIVTMNFQEAPKISGGPLNGSYKFSQFHFHWGENDTFGSEDTIDNQSFPVELHMVFFHSKYDSFSEALHYNNGLTVLAFFYYVEGEANKNYKELTKLLRTITEPMQQTLFRTPITMFDLMSSNLNKYYTYFGSLTTPPCSEVVTWIDFAVPIPITPIQIQDFRALNGYHGPIGHNFRPVQPLNDRTVFENVPLSETNTLNQGKHPIPNINTNDIDMDSEEDEEIVPGSIGDIEPVFKDYRKENTASITSIGNICLALTLIAASLF
ncbi:CA14.2 family protein [Megaselia abdita]